MYQVQNFESFGSAPIDAPIAGIALRPVPDASATTKGQIAAERVPFIRMPLNSPNPLAHQRTTKNFRFIPD
jgi:hypothetical protein